MNDTENGDRVAIESTPLLEGVCCAYCGKFQTGACPVQTASPWSRWKDFCGEYTPNPDEPYALTIAEAVKVATSNAEVSSK
jgi:hypothetical protein